MEKLKEVLNYDRETGVFTWAVNVGLKMRAGSVAGYKNPKGYVVIAYKGKLYRAHRIAWFFITGSIPTLEIDHMNGTRDDNRAENLREVTRQGNSQNQGHTPRNNISGRLGVFLNREKNRWEARIKTDGKSKRLGRFKNKEDAAAAYVAAKRLLHSTCTI